MITMAKKKADKKEESFDLQKALNEINPYFKKGFYKFIAEKQVKTQKDFNKLLEKYGGY